MRLVVDAMCAEYGGIRTYVEQLLARWSERHPGDEVHAVLRAGSTIATPGLVRHELRVHGPDVLGRPWAQATALHRLVRELRPDAFLATAPTPDPRRTGAPTAVVVLDLRAEILPEQFSRGRRLLRAASYGRSYQLADAFIAISQRSLDDLHRLHPRTARRPGAVAHLGADHVHGWPAPGTDGPAVAFAHHTNKNPELVVEGWRLLADRGVRVPLTFLGVSAGLRDRLTGLIDRHRLADLVALAPYLPDEEFRAVFARSRMVVFPSDFEGFGLPIVEGMALRKPVVIGPDAGALEVAGGHAAVLRDFTPAALADAVVAAGARTGSDLDAAQAWAARFSWATTVDATRTVLTTLAPATTGGRVVA